MKDHLQNKDKKAKRKSTIRLKANFTRSVLFIPSLMKHQVCPQFFANF